MIDKYRPETCCVIGNYYSVRAPGTRGACHGVGTHSRASLACARAGKPRGKAQRRGLTPCLLRARARLDQLKAEHEKAVLYFRRALKLNRHFLSAWTLMGHEYVELKNTAAAVDAYRHAVDINPKDYRAWYAWQPAHACRPPHT